MTDDIEQLFRCLEMLHQEVADEGVCAIPVDVAEIERILLRVTNAIERARSSCKRSCDLDRRRADVEALEPRRLQGFEREKTPTAMARSDLYNLRVSEDLREETILEEHGELEVMRPKKVR